MLNSVYRYFSSSERAVAVMSHSIIDFATTCLYVVCPTCRTNICTVYFVNHNRNQNMAEFLWECRADIVDKKRNQPLQLFPMVMV